MQCKWIVWGALFGMIAVGAGALGAHALTGRIDAADLASYEVAVRYQMYHALALLAVAWMASVRVSRVVSASGFCFVLGIVCFCGSIHGLIFINWRWLGPITPIGGVLLMIGWLLLGVAALCRRQLPPRSAA